MKISEGILLAGLAVFSLVLLWGSLDMPYSNPDEQTFGPGFVPLNLSVALLGLVGMAAFKAVAGARRAPRHAPPAAAEGTAGALAAAARTGVLVAAMGMVGVGILGMTVIGVLPALAILLAAVSWRFAGHSPVRSLAVSVVTVLAIYGIFNLWLGIPLI